MGKGKRNHQRTAAAKANNSSPRRGEKSKQRRRKSESDRDQNEDLVDTPETTQKANGPGTRSNVASTRKQLFKKPTKSQPANDDSDNSSDSNESDRNSDIDTTGEETKKIIARVGRVDTAEDSDSDQK
jgi:hypothetical protein